MKFDLQAILLNPFFLIFFTVCIGNLFGELKISKFSFGLTGSLFMGLLVGFFLTKYATTIKGDSIHYIRAHNIISGNVISSDISNLSLLIFIVGTGLLASKTIAYALKKFGKQFIVLSIVIPMVGGVSSYGTSLLVSSINPYKVTGTYSGSLTSSSALAVSNESSVSTSKELAMNFSNQTKKNKERILKIINESKRQEAILTGRKISEDLTIENTTTLSEEDVFQFVKEAQAGVGIGYSIGYPFGVLVVILAVNFLPVLFGIDVEKEKNKYFLDKEKEKNEKEKNEREKNEKENKIQKTEKTKLEIKEVAMDFAAISFVAFLGIVFGRIQIYLGPLGYFSLGNTGGGIIAALIFGYIGKIGPMTFRIDSKILGNMRSYFLSIFLGITGLNYGYKTVLAVMGDGFSIAIIATVVAASSILVGFLLGYYVFRINWMLLSGALVGGMTSAPGLGAAIDAVGCDEPAAAYGATQPVATLMMIVFSLVIYKLPF